MYNGATYYIDVFGKRFQNELEKMKMEVQKWQNSPDMMTSPLMTPKIGEGQDLAALVLDDSAMGHSRQGSVDRIPLLNDAGATGIDGGAKDVARERKVGEMPY